MWSHEKWCFYLFLTNIHILLLHWGQFSLIRDSRNLYVQWFCGQYHIVHAQSGNGHALSGVHSIISPAWWWGGGGCTPSPSHSIYHHKQRCGVLFAPAEKADTPPLISPLPLNVLCGQYMYCGALHMYSRKNPKTWDSDWEGGLGQLKHKTQENPRNLILAP